MRLRPRSVHALHAALGDATLAWSTGACSPTAEYLVRRGLAHLIVLGRADDAERRLADVRFTMAMADGFPSHVVPFTYLRLVGLDRVERALSPTPAVADTWDEFTAGQASGLSAFAYRAGLNHVAHALARAAIRSRERLLGPSNPQLIVTTNTLALVLIELAQAEEACRLFRHLLAWAERTLPPDDDTVLTTALNLGLALETQGEVCEAEAHYRRALEGYARAGAGSSRNALIAKGHLGSLLAPSQPSEAERLHREAHEGLEALLGPTNPATMSALKSLALSRLALGHADEAAEMLDKVHAFRARSFGAAHPFTLDSAHLRGSALHSAGRFEEARAPYEAALEGGRKAHGETHPSTIHITNDLAWLLLDLGESVPARPLFERVAQSWAGKRGFMPLWPRLGLALCTALDGAGFQAADAILLELAALLGDEHPRVRKGRERMDRVARRLT